jgi:hypothetical protein
VETGRGGYSLFWIILEVDLHLRNIFIWGPTTTDTMAGMVHPNFKPDFHRPCWHNFHADVQNTGEMDISSDIFSEMDGSADNLQLPIEGWLLFFTKTIFDREMSISENSVRPASILHNSSLIMGKQIINILPEG